MIAKDDLYDFIQAWKNFDNNFEKVNEVLFGERHYYYSYESPLYVEVGKMLDIFLDSHFTEDGEDWINYWLFEDVEDKIVTVTREKDIFNKEEVVEYHINTFDELWDFLMTDVKAYFKNV